MPPKGERRKQQIINTAKEMFLEKGFQSTHIGQVCEKLDIARGTVYQYFSNKKEILFNLFNSVIEQIEDILDLEEMTELMKKDPTKAAVEKKIIERISNSLTIIIREPIIIKLIFNEIDGIDAEISQNVYNAMKNIRDIMAQEIEEIKKWGVYKSDINPKITASMLLGGIMMLVHEHEKNEINVLNEDVIKSLVNHYLTGTLIK